MHAFHPLLDGYSEGQVFADGCAECGNHEGRLSFALQFLDDDAFAAAWDRAEAKAAGRLTDVSDTEAALLDDLWAVRFKLSMIGALRQLERAA